MPLVNGFFSNALGFLKCRCFRFATLIVRIRELTINGTLRIDFDSEDPYNP